MITYSQDQSNPFIDFFHRYQAFREQTWQQLWTETETAYSGLIKRYIQERPKAMEAERILASKYNMFSILKMRHLEVKLHTPMLENLLNPTGSHAQGDLFYRHFIAFCTSKDQQQRFLNVSPYDIEVSSETRNPYGQIDIFVYSSNPHNRFAIIIENKIWALDQFRQLYRYYQYAAQALGLSPDQICIVYLTLTGKDPDYSGLELAEKKALDSVLVKVGYHSHVIPFLKKAVEQIGSDKVKHTLEQYIQTLNTL